jgi:hypothetical protein
MREARVSCARTSTRAVAVQPRRQFPLLASKKLGIGETESQDTR